MVLPGSKSETNRALVLAALSSGPSMITGGLEARDTQLMRDALRTLGVDIVEGDGEWQITPPKAFAAGGAIDCGLAGTVMRASSRRSPPLRAAQCDSTATSRRTRARWHRCWVLSNASAPESTAPAIRFRSISPAILSYQVRDITVDASESSQFLSGLLLAGARYTDGVDIQHIGDEIPSRTHVQMTLAMLRARGVEIDDTKHHRWVVSPGTIQPVDVKIRPDLSNAAPFLAAAAITGGTVTVANWPSTTMQPGDAIREILEHFGAEVTLEGSNLRVQGTDHIHGVDLDLSDAAELTPVVAAVAALADDTSHLRGDRTTSGP